MVAETLNMDEPWVKQWRVWLMLKQAVVGATRSSSAEIGGWLQIPSDMTVGQLSERQKLIIAETLRAYEAIGGGISRNGPRFQPTNILPGVVKTLAAERKI